MERGGIAVRCSALLAICQESFMKHDNASCNLIGKRQGKENLLSNALMNQFWIIPKTKPLIVVRITHKSATLATQLFQQRQSFVDK